MLPIVTPTLRDPGTQAAFKRAALDNGIQICSRANIEYVKKTFRMPPAQ